jgi:class 3 adenylate cyclase
MFVLRTWGTAGRSGGRERRDGRSTYAGGVPSVGTVVVMFTDLVGSTELLVALGEDRFDSVRDEHESLVGRSINTHHGELVKHTGDGFMAVFPGAAEAIAAATEIQRKISSRNERSAVGLDVRIGISAGDVAIRAGDYHGVAAVEAARLCAAASGGQILASKTVRVLAGSRGGHDFVALGELDLKGLPPVAAVAVRWSDAAPVGVATHQAKGSRRRVPAVGRLLGRDREVDSLVRALEAGGPVVVLGPAGIGKSTLCRAVLREAATPTIGLAVVAGEVGDSAGGWPADGGVVAVIVVAVEPGVQGAGAAGV